MEDFLNNSIKYLSGEFSPAEKDLFIREINESEKLSENFSVMKSSDEILKNTAKSFTPSNRSKSVIFDKIGYNSALLGDAIKPFYRSGYFIAAVSSIISIIATLFTVNYFGGFDGAKNQAVLEQTSRDNNIAKHTDDKFNRVVSNNEINTTKTPKVLSYTLITPNNIQAASIDLSKAGKIQSSGTINKEQSSISCGAESNLNNLSQNEDIIAEKTNNISINKASSIFSNDFANNREIRNFGGVGMIFPQFMVNPQIEEPSAIIDRKLDVEILFASSWNLNNGDIRQKSPSAFSNMGLGLSYKLLKNCGLGFEIRKEIFSIKNNSIDSVGKEFMDVQSPNLTSFCANAKYYFLRFKDTKPFVKIDIGGNNYGLVTRASLGADFDIGDNIALSCQGQCSSLFYGQGHETYSTQNLSFICGLIYHF